MKKKTTILLNDRNSYFLAGLQYGLIEYFTERHTQIDFFYGGSSEKPDIIFQALHQSERADICRHFPADEPQPLYFVIRDRTERCFTPPIRCIATSGTLYRNQSINNILEMLELAIQLNSQPQERTQQCPACHRQPLTEREHQVLQYLRQGMSQSQTARILQLKVKTVHSHKRSVMQKLNFTRNSELLRWLLHSSILPLNQNS